MEQLEFQEYYTRLNIIFVSYTEEWLEDGKFHEEVFLRSPYFKMMEISFGELEEQILIIDRKFGFRKELACRKLKALLEFLRSQVEVWSGLSKASKQQLRDRYETTGFPFIYLCEKFNPTDSERQKVVTKQLDKEQNKKNAEIREQERREVDKYFDRFNTLIKHSRKNLLNKLSKNFVQDLLKYESFKDARKKIDRLFKIIEGLPSQEALMQDPAVQPNYSKFLNNLEELKNQLSIFLENLQIFEQNGKFIINNQLLLSEDFLKKQQLFFISKEINQVEQLTEIINDYIQFHGLEWVRRLMKVKPIKTKKGFAQDFFKNMGIYVPTVVPTVLPPGPKGEVIKTIKQGRQLSLSQTLKKEKIIGVRNNELSKPELIIRIEDNLKTIRISCRNLLNSAKVPAKEKKLVELILDRNALIIIDRLPNYELGYLVKVADVIYGDLATCKSLGLKFLR